MLSRKNFKKIKKRDDDERATSPLHYAACVGDLKLLIGLVRRGADINFLDKSGESALDIAVGLGNIDCVHLLVKMGANINRTHDDGQTVLHLAAGLGRTELIPFLIKNGCGVDAKGKGGETPLHSAVYRSHASCVEALLKYGASVDGTFGAGKTALHIAAAVSPDCIDVLLRENANIFAVDDNGVCSLRLAIEVGVKRLKRLCGGNYDISSSNGVTPLHIASSCMNSECLEMLIGEGFDVNIATSKGDTPLHFACCTSEKSQNDSAKMECVQNNIGMLLAAGASFHKKNNLGFTPFHVAAMYNQSAALSFLYKCGVNVNLVSGSKECTALHLASEKGNLECIKFLIENDADITALDTDHNTALMLAAKQSHFQCVQFLLENDAPLWEITRN